MRLHNWGVLHYFDVVTASAEAGYEKPDLRIFRLALEQAGCNPQKYNNGRRQNLKMILFRQGSSV